MVGINLSKFCEILLKACGDRVLWLMPLSIVARESPEAIAPSEARISRTLRDRVFLYHSNIIDDAA